MKHLLSALVCLLIANSYAQDSTKRYRKNEIALNFLGKSGLLSLGYKRTLWTIKNGEIGVGLNFSAGTFLPAYHSKVINNFGPSIFFNKGFTQKKRAYIGFEIGGYRNMNFWGYATIRENQKQEMDDDGVGSPSSVVYLSASFGKTVKNYRISGDICFSYIKGYYKYQGIGWLPGISIAYTF